MWVEAADATLPVTAWPIEAATARAELVLVQGRLELAGSALLYEPADIRWVDPADLRLLAPLVRDSEALPLPSRSGRLTV